MIILDYRGYKNFQLDAYNECHREFGKDFDWIAYIDVDEFITFGTEVGCDNIYTYLEQAVDADIILMNRLMFGDNDEARQGIGGVVDRFTMPIWNTYNNHVVKSLVRGNVNIKFVRNPHCADGVKLRVTDDCFCPQSDNGPFK